MLGGVAVHLLGSEPVAIGGLFLAPWRATFIVVALPGLFLAVLFAAAVREPPRINAIGAPVPAAPRPAAPDRLFARGHIPLFLILLFASPLGQAILTGLSS